MMFNISMRASSDDALLFSSVINQGIDARLEAFTQSRFHIENGRLSIDIHYNELQILTRRLLEVETDEADQWADDIVESAYSVET